MSRRLDFGGGNPFGEREGTLGVVELQGGAALPSVDATYPPSRGAPVQIIEPVQGWWRQQGAFGFAFNGLVPGENEIIPLTEQLHLPGPPRQWWIHWFRYNRQLITEATPFGNWELRGRVTYGVGGFQNVVECDLMQGIQFPIVASSLKVELVTYNPLSDFAYDAADVEGNKIVAGAFFGDGAGGGALPPTWTTQSFIVSLAPLSVDVVVPDFARSVCLHTTVFDPALLNNTFLFFNTPNVTQKTIRVSDAYAELTREKGIAIPAGTNQIRLDAPAALAPARFSLQFFLAL